jgi:Na+/H+-dicarboxylate symporter
LKTPTLSPFRILAGLALGLAVGGLGAWAGFPMDRAAGWASAVGGLWLDALRMTVVPLVFSLIVTGIAAAAATTGAGGLTRRAFVLFALLLLGSALLAALLGPLLLGTWSPSPEALEALRSSLPAAATPEIPAIGEWFRTLIPTNPVAAAAEGAIVPLTIFAILFGIAAARLPNDGGRPVLAFFATVAETMLVIVRWVLLLAPIGVFALAFALAARIGLGAGAALAHYVLVQIVITLILGLSMYPLAMLAGRVRPGAFARAAAPAQAVAASTQSSLASLPPMLAGAERLNLPGETSSVVLPLAVAVFRIAAPATIVIVALAMARMTGTEVGLTQMAIVVALAIRRVTCED